MNARATKSLGRRLAVSVLMCALGAGLSGVAPVFAQDYPINQDAQNAPAATLQELDQMLAPIALYPDSLLTQILMASTYPLEVVQAARWSRANPGVTGDQAVRAVDNQNWDPSVKSLAAFPQVLELMDSRLDWTERLGNAFLSQESQVWDSVQGLRSHASAAGNLQSNEQVIVEQDGPTFVIQPAQPEIIYVPYYDPLIVYGDWWWPDYAPVRWSPWAGYYARTGYGRGFYWGSGIHIGFGFFFGGIDWRQRHVNVINYNSFYYRNVNRHAPGNGWQHDPVHRRGVPYRNPILRQEFGRTPGATDSRRDYRGRLPGSGGRSDAGERTQANRGQRNDYGQPQPGTANAGGQGQGQGQGIQRPSTSTAQGLVPEVREQKNNAVRGGGARPRAEQVPQALEGVGNGQDARNASARGQASYPRANMPQRSQAPAIQAPIYNAPVAPRPQLQQQMPVQPQMQQRAAPPPQQAPAQQQAPGPHNGQHPRGEQR